jgi:hypothetical protein
VGGHLHMGSLLIKPSTVQSNRLSCEAVDLAPRQSFLGTRLDMRVYGSRPLLDA